MSVLATLVDMAVHAGMVSTCFPAFVLRVLLDGCVKQVKTNVRRLLGSNVPNCTFLWLKPCKFQSLLRKCVSEIIFHNCTWYQHTTRFLWYFFIFMYVSVFQNRYVWSFRQNSILKNQLNFFLTSFQCKICKLYIYILQCQIHHIE